MALPLAPLYKCHSLHPAQSGSLPARTPVLSWKLYCWNPAQVLGPRFTAPPTGALFSRNVQPVHSRLPCSGGHGARSGRKQTLHQRPYGTAGARGANADAAVKAHTRTSMHIAHTNCNCRGQCKHRAHLYAQRAARHACLVVVKCGPNNVHVAAVLQGCMRGSLAGRHWWCVTSSCCQMVPLQQAKRQKGSATWTATLKQVQAAALPKQWHNLNPHHVRQHNATAGQAGASFQDRQGEATCLDIHCPAVMAPVALKG